MTYVAARARTGKLAHAIYVKDLDVFKRKRYRVAMCMQSETHVLIAPFFDLDAAEHEGHKTCQKCVRRVRSWEATKKFLREWSERSG